VTENQTYQQLRGHLAALRMTAAAEALAAELDHARTAGLSHTAFAERLLSVEVTAAHARRQVSLARFACLPAPWRIDDFDFDAQPSLDRQLVRELASLRFLDDATNVLLIASRTSACTASRPRCTWSRSGSGTSRSPRAWWTPHQRTCCCASGLSAGMRSSAEAADPASPTTAMSGSVSSSSLTPRRTILLSSRWW
jgi:hypothetical protein